MLIAVERLLIKVRQPKPRADELIALRQRLRDELARDVDDQERELARAARAGKLAISAELSAVAACRTCATGQPSARDGYDGGACCSGVTADLFDDHELAALAHAGTRPHDLVAPAAADRPAGCAFRGRQGCSLAVAHRPGRCVRYLCGALRRELRQRGQLPTVEAKLADHDRAVQQFAVAHQAGLDRDVVAPILDAIAAAVRDA